MTVFIRNFPPELGKEASAGHHYMIIDSYASKNAVTTGKGDHKSSIGLYIPAGSLKTSFKGEYSATEGGATTARITNFGETFFSGALNKVTGGLAKKSDFGGFLSAQGQVPNNHMAMIYKGPGEFRTHSFAFKFFPKNEGESKTVREIIQEFQDGTLPGLSGDSIVTSAYFKSPRHHQIGFYQGPRGNDGTGSQNTNLFNIGMSVIEDMSVNYDPQTMVGFHSDGSPVAIDLSLTFKEITLQVSGDKMSSVEKTQRNALVLQSQSQSAQNAGSSALVDGQIQFNPNTGRIVGGF